MVSRYLFWFCQENPAFRLAELDSLLSLFKCDVKFYAVSKEKPFLIVESNCEDDVDKLKQATNRSVCIRSLFHLWVHGTSSEDLINQLKLCELSRKPEYADENKSFKINVETYGKKITLQQKVEKIEELAFLPFLGPINLTSPDNIFQLIEYYGHSQNKTTKQPTELFFGKWLADGNTKFAHQICLKNRKFIANTSMVPRLAAIMSNLGLVKDGDLVIDPFVGSGSLLVAAAKFGAYTIGSDIDYLLLHGKRKPSRQNVTKRDPDESVLSNFSQYGLTSRYLDVIVADASKTLWRKFTVDAIITDPPYGIREHSRKIGTDKYDVSWKIPKEHIGHHIPSKVFYSLYDIIKDLFNLAVDLLKIGGRLVFWIPKMQKDEIEEILPSHSNFKIISSCNQIMKFNVSRVLVCYEKISNQKSGQLHIPVALLNFRELYLNEMKVLAEKPRATKWQANGDQQCLKDT